MRTGLIAAFALAVGLAGGSSPAAEPAPVSSTNAVAPPSAEARSDAERRGRAALQDELYPLAERRFREALELAYSPAERTASAVWLARTLLAQGRAPEAVQLLQGLSSAANAAEAGLHFWLAQAQFESGDPDATLLTLAGPGIPVDFDSVSLLARTCARTGRYDEAFAACAAAEERFPDAAGLPALMLDWARWLREQGTPLEAAAVLDRLLARRPADPAVSAARLMLGRLRHESGDIAGAETILRSLAEDPDCRTDERAQAWLSLAAVAEARTNAPAALAALDRGIELGRATPWASRLGVAKARLLIRTGDWERGRALLREQIARTRADPQAAEAQLFLARHLLDRERFAEAATEYQNYLEAFEDPAGLGEAHLGKGWSLAALKRHAESAAEFEKAADTHPDPAQAALARFKAGDAWFADGKYELARAQYRRFADRYPGDDRAPQASYQAAECLWLLKRGAEAAVEFQGFEQRWPRHPLAGSAALRRIRVTEEEGKWTAARDAYDEVAARYTNAAVRSRALLARGLVLYRLGEFPAAEAGFSRVVKEHPGTPSAEQAFFMRGWCLYLMGRDAEAVRVCREFIARFPASSWAPDVQFWLGEHAFNRGEFKDAETAFAELARAYPTSPLAAQSLFWAGRSAAGAKEYLRAIEYFNRLAKAYPESAHLSEARFAQGDALSELGQFAAAILAFEEIVKREPDSYLALLAWGRKGDCHFTLGADDPARYDLAVQAYRTVRENGAAPQELQLQAEYKIGRCLEKMEKTGEAFERYMNVVYDHLADREKGGLGAPVWFARAAFNAAALKERQEEWREAVNIYRRIVDDGGSAGTEARDRIQKIRLEKWMLF